MHLIFCINSFYVNSLILALKFKKNPLGCCKNLVTNTSMKQDIWTNTSLKDVQKFVDWDGLITTRSFFNPCCSITSIFEEEFVFQSGKQINKYPQHEDLYLFIPPSSFGEGTQESCIVAEEEEQLEPEIAEFLTSLVSEEEYQLGL